MVGAVGLSAMALGLSLGVAACSVRPLDLAPAPSGPPVCPLEGCGRARIDAIESAAAPAACPAAGQAPCGGSSAADCTSRALAAWAEARDDRAVACVARTLAEACSLGDADGCSYAGRLWLDGRGVPRDTGRGLTLLERACDDGAALACRVAVRWLADAEHARGVDGSAALRGRLDAQNECLNGVPDACFDVGLGYYRGREGYTRDAARSAASYERGCALGQRTACNNLGDAEEYGQGVPRDLARAAALYERACRLGEPLACANLGHLLENGEGVARDVARARTLYRDACSAGDVYGCLHAEMSATDLATSPAAAARALERWTRACDARQARACSFVGLVYEDGPDGLARDEQKSQKAMTRGCELGDRRACDWVRVHGP